MKPPRLRLLFAGLLAAVALGMLLVGCASGPKPPKGKPHEIRLWAKEKTRRLPVTVWLIPARRQQDIDLVKGRDVDQLIADAKDGKYPDKKEYLAKDLEHQSITVKDMVWFEWTKKLNADCLVVLADIPKVLEGAKNRSAAISLDKRDWRNYGDQKIVIEISEDRGVIVENVPKP